MTSSGRDQAEVDRRVYLAECERNLWTTEGDSSGEGVVDMSDLHVVLCELDRLRAENERLRAARDRVLALCGEVHQDRIDSCGKVEDERLDVCVVRALLAPVSTDTDEKESR